MYALLWQPHLYWTKSIGVHYPWESSKLNADSKPDSCQWWMSVPGNASEHWAGKPQPQQNTMWCAETLEEGLLWLCNSCTSQLQKGLRLLPPPLRFPYLINHLSSSECQCFLTGIPKELVPPWYKTPSIFKEYISTLLLVLKLIFKG